MSDKMSKEELEQRVKELEKEREERKKAIRQYNENAKKNWDNFSCRVPKGTKEKITSKNFSVNGLVNKLLLSALSSLGNFTAETKVKAENIDFVVLPILNKEDLENCYCMGVDEKVVENLEKHDVTPEIVANDAFDYFIGFLEGVEEDERIERERMESEPLKQSHTAMKTEQADILPYGSEKGQEKDRIKCKSVMVDVDGQEVELWLDQYHGVFNRHDAEQLEAFRRWKGQQMPKADDEKPVETAEPMQSIGDFLTNEQILERIKGGGASV